MKNLFLNNMQSIPFIETIRSGIVENIHRVSVVVLQKSKIIMSYGNINLIVPMRSTAKPFMLLPLLEMVEKARVLLTEKQISIMSSSHNGENIHREIIKQILTLANATTSDLHCGIHLPYFDWLYPDFFGTDKDSERQLFNNCSGKHAGMLLLCEYLSRSKKSYWMPDHHIQIIISSSVKKLLNIKKSDFFGIGVDGCGVPTYCVTLKKIAELYMNFPKISELSIVYSSMLNEPYFLAGKDRVETSIVSDLRIVAKSGSDGLFCVSIPNDNIGIALKIEDGDDDSAESAIIEILNRLGYITERSLKNLNHFWHLPILTTTGELVGCYSPIDEAKSLK